MLRREKLDKIVHQIMEKVVGKIIGEAYQKVFQNTNEDGERVEESVTKEKEKDAEVIQVEESDSLNKEDAKQAVEENVLDHSQSPKLNEMDTQKLAMFSSSRPKFNWNAIWNEEEERG